MGKIKMEKKIPKSVQKYLSSVISGIKRQTPHFRASTAIKIFNGRKRPKSLPFSAAGHFFNLRRRRRYSHPQPEPGTAAGAGNTCSSATLDDIDQFLFENFRSLYGDNEGGDREGEEAVEEFNDALSLFENPPPEVADLCGSDRFFFTPVSSGSLIEEARTRSEEAGFDLDSEKTIGGSAKGTSHNFGDSVAIVTASVSPYEDFLRSMEEVTKARSGDELGRIDWDFMEELLFCFLRLNEKKNYRFVLRAFVDLVMDLRGSSAGGYSGDRGGELADAEWRERKSRLRA